MRRARSARPSSALAGAVVLVGLLALGAPAASGAPLALDNGAPYSSYDTGTVHVVVARPVPTVNLSQDADAGVGASLTLVKIVELSGATSPTTTPSVVAAAFESRVQSFNASGPSGSDVVVGLVANLTVYRDSGLLFPLLNSDLPLRPLVPIAPTTLEVTVRATPSREVLDVSATISNWPWVAPSDLLAVGWQFGVVGDTGFAGCAGTHPAAVPETPCGGDAFAFGNSTWGWEHFEMVQGLTPTGPSAQVQWGPTVALPDGGSAPVIAGAQRTATDSLEVVYGAEARGAASLTFGLSYALAAPSLPPVLLHGSWAAYAGGAAVAAVLAGAGLYGARRRDRRLLDAL